MNRREWRDFKRVLKTLPMLFIATWLAMSVFEWVPKIMHKIKKKRSELYNKAIDEKMEKLRAELEDEDY